MSRLFYFITHPNVAIRRDVPVTRWPLSDIGRSRMRVHSERMIAPQQVSFLRKSLRPLQMSSSPSLSSRFVAGRRQWMRRDASRTLCAPLRLQMRRRGLLRSLRMVQSARSSIAIFPDCRFQDVGISLRTGAATTMRFNSIRIGYFLVGRRSMIYNVL